MGGKEMAISQVAMEAEIIRIKRVSAGLDARISPHNSHSGLFNIEVQDNRRPADNEAMNAVDTDILVARVTNRPGVWAQYEPGSGGASAFDRTDQEFTAAVGGGPS